MNVTWENWVHEQFRDMDTPAKRRQKYIVLDLPADGQAVPASKLSDLSGRVATAYANKGPKTTTRDLNELVHGRMIRRVRGGVIANRGIIRAFLPVRPREANGRVIWRTLPMVVPLVNSTGSASWCFGVWRCRLRSGVRVDAVTSGG